MTARDEGMGWRRPGLRNGPRDRGGLQLKATLGREEEEDMKNTKNSESAGSRYWRARADFQALHSLQDLRNE